MIFATISTPDPRLPPRPSAHRSRHTLHALAVLGQDVPTRPKTSRPRNAAEAAIRGARCGRAHDPAGVVSVRHGSSRCAAVRVTAPSRCRRGAARGRRGSRRSRRGRARGCAAWTPSGIFLPGSLNRLASLRARDDLPVVLAEHRRDRLQRGRVGDPGEQQLGPEQGQEPVGGLAPPGARLGEVLKRGEEGEALPAALGRDLRQLLKRRDVRDLIQREQHPAGEPAGGVRPVGRAADLGQEAADDRCDRGLLLGGRVDVDGVAAGDERGRVEVRVARRRQRALARVGLERVGGGGEDRGPLAVLRVQQPDQRPERQPARPLILQQDPGLVELVTHHPVHDRLHLPAVHGRGVQQGREQRLRAVGPVRAVGRARPRRSRSSPGRSRPPRPTSARW